ncbi:MAG: class I SAM-dependent methyltransferase [Nitrospiraceae bacterium]|nr:MAG: class I SAM-dependent methyltransferase [Nitrospiraceae bacterium]
MRGEKYMEFIPCEICGVTDERELSTRDRDGEYLRTVICKRCGLVYTNPRPEISELREYYEHSYRLDYKGVRQPKKKHIVRAAKVAAERLQEIRGYIFQGMKSLDIGSGGGEVAYAMQLMGLEGSGLEPNEGYADYARNVLRLPIYSGCIENASLPQVSYDIITMYHVIEHLHGPLKALRSLHSSLKTDGLFVVECPNAESRCQAPSHRLHRAHLYNFNMTTLQALGEIAGFHTVRMSLSSDGGNITAIFRKTYSAGVLPDLTHNYQVVMKAWEGHSKMGYYLSKHPYRRFTAKALRIMKEGIVALFTRKGETLLRKNLEKHLLPPSTQKQRRWSYGLAGTFAGIALFISSLWSISSLMDHSEEIRTFIERHQDGNDVFIVVHGNSLKGLSQVPGVVLSQHKKELKTTIAGIMRPNVDIHLLVEDDHLHHIKETIETASLKTMKIISVRGNAYHFLTTETHYGPKL